MIEIEIGRSYDLLEIPESMEIDDTDVGSMIVTPDSKRLLDYALSDQTDSIDFEVQQSSVNNKSLAFMLSVGLSRLQNMNRLFDNLKQIEDRLMQYTESSEVNPGILMSIHQKMLDRLDKEISTYQSVDNPTVNLFSMIENKVLNITPGNKGMSNLLDAGAKEFNRAQDLSVTGRKKIGMIMDSVKGKI